MYKNHRHRYVKKLENKFTLYCGLHVIIGIIQFVKCPGAKLIDDL